MMKIKYCYLLLIVSVQIDAEFEKFSDSLTIKSDPHGRLSSKKESINNIRDDQMRAAKRPKVQANDFVSDILQGSSAFAKKSSSIELAKKSTLNLSDKPKIKSLEKANIEKDDFVEDILQGSSKSDQKKDKLSAQRQQSELKRENAKIKKNSRISYHQRLTQDNVLEAIDDNFASFDNDEQAYQKLSEFLNETKLSIEFKNILQLKLLESLNYTEINEYSIERVIRMTQLLILHGATPTKIMIDKALSNYNKFMHNKFMNVKRPGILAKISNYFARKFMPDSSEAQERKKKEKAVAAHCAELVFILDDAVVEQERNVRMKKHIETEQQRVEIKKLEHEYKPWWNRATHWIRRNVWFYNKRT